MEKSHELRSLQEIDRLDTRSFDSSINFHLNNNINKRQASSRASSFQELLSSKRTKIPLIPVSSPNTSDNSLLHHCTAISDDPIRSVQDQSPASQTVQNAQQFTVSDPIPVTNGIPPRAPKNSPISGIICCGHQESPDTRRLKRIRGHLREMKQWWNEAVREDDDEDIIGDQIDDNKTSKAHLKIEEPHPLPPPCEEAVWVENMDKDCLGLHFKCPCGAVYELLLSGNNCYYKLKN